MIWYDNILSETPFKFSRSATAVGGEELKYSANESAKDIMLVHTLQLAKTNNKSIFLGRMISSGLSDVAIHSDKTRLKKLMKMMMMIIIIITNKLHKMMVFSGRHNLTSATN